MSSYTPDDISRSPRPDSAVAGGGPPAPPDTQHAGYIPRVGRPAARPAPAAPPPAGPAPYAEALPGEDRPTVAIPVPGRPDRPAAPARPAAPVYIAVPPPAQVAAPHQPAAEPPPASYAPTLAPVYDPARVVMPDAAPRRRGRAGAILGVLAGLTVLLLIGLFALAGWYEQQYAGHLYPGVRVLGVDVGGKTPDEARILLENKVATFTDRPVTLAWNKQQWTPKPAQLGMKVNLDSTIDNAYNVGRTGNLVNTWRDRLTAGNTGRVVALSVSLDENALQAYLQQQVAPQIDQPLQEGDVWLQGEKVNSTDAQVGRQLQVYPAVEAVRNSLSHMTSSRIDLPVTVTQPQIAEAEIQQTAQTLRAMLSGPLAAHHGGKQYTVDARKISQQLLILQRNPDPAAPHHFTIAFQDDNLQKLVADWADDNDTAPQNARFAWNGGQLAVLKESQDGVKIDRPKAVAALKTALATTDQRNVDLPTVTTPPKVSSKDVGALGIKELIGTGTTSYVGSSDARFTNIKIAAGYLNGVVVPPGDTFSFLDAVAPITLDRGYVEGYVIAAERTQKGVGGGVCQVSTTTFRAAFYSAVQITERHQHAYRVSWYESMGEPVGFDAAVFDPGVDLRFVNTTPGFLLIQTDMSNQQLHVNFYGTKIADDVKLVGPQISNQVAPPPDIYQIDPSLPPGTKKQVETAHAGLDTTITRQIIKGGQVASSDTYFSRYEPWPNWFMVAPGVQTPSPPRPAAAATPTP